MPSTHEWLVNKPWCVYDGMLPRDNENEVSPFKTTWTDLAAVTLSAITQAKKDKYCMISFTYRI